MSAYNEDQALANHTAKCLELSRANAEIERRDRRIKDLAGMVSWLQNRVAELEADQSPLGQAEKVFK